MRVALLRLRIALRRLLPVPRAQWRGRPLRFGDIVRPHEIVALRYEQLAEDGRVCRMFDLIEGRTGAQGFPPEANPNSYPITVVD